jgi:hypothetical protein
MIIWQGWGFLALLVPMATYGVAFFLSGKAMGSGYPAMHTWPGCVGLFVGAAIVWIIAKKLDVPGRTVTNPFTGKPAVFKPQHTLFFIPMKYVAAVWAVIGFLLLFFKGAKPWSG